jgi:hypothetical protein
VMSRLSDAHLARVMPRLSDAELARVMPRLSDAELARVMSRLGDAELARVMSRLSDAHLARVMPHLSDADLARTPALPEVPIVPNLDARVLAAVGGNGAKLHMEAWHSSCGTTHCRGGWEVTLAGEAGAALERRVGMPLAAQLIHEVSTGRMAPNYYASDADALADIKRCAAEAA